VSRFFFYCCNFYSCIENEHPLFLSLSLSFPHSHPLALFLIPLSLGTQTHIAASSRTQGTRRNCQSNRGSDILQVSGCFHFPLAEAEFYAQITLTTTISATKECKSSTLRELNHHARVSRPAYAWRKGDNVFNRIFLPLTVRCRLHASQDAFLCLHRGCSIC
jgi:hypothetical protein